MAAAIRFTSSIVGHTILSKQTREKHPHCNLAISKLNRFHQAKIYITPQLTYMKNIIERKSRKLFVIPPTSSMFDPNSLSPAQTIMQFYSAINKKNLKQLEELIAEDCFFEDYSFPTPFQKKKEVLHFLKQLITCMREDQNMQFNVEQICEGSDYTASVNWHLDWRNIQVPFTRGCSYYSLSLKGDKLVIKKARVLIQSPIKPGVVALTVFRIVTSLFDAFPAATEWFLKSPHIMFQLLLKAYSICIWPIISPFLAWYIKLLNFTAYNSQLHRQNSSLHCKDCSQVVNSFVVRNSTKLHAITQLQNVLSQEF